MSNDWPDWREQCAKLDRELQRMRESTDPKDIARVAQYDANLKAAVQSWADWIDAVILERALKGYLR